MVSDDSLDRSLELHPLVDNPLLFFHLNAESAAAINTKDDEGFDQDGHDDSEEEEEPLPPIEDYASCLDVIFCPTLASISTTEPAIPIPILTYDDIVEMLAEVEQNAPGTEAVDESADEEEEEVEQASTLARDLPQRLVPSPANVEMPSPTQLFGNMSFDGQDESALVVSSSTRVPDLPNESELPSFTPFDDQGRKVNGEIEFSQSLPTLPNEVEQQPSPGQPIGDQQESSDEVTSSSSILHHGQEIFKSMVDSISILSQLKLSDSSQQKLDQWTSKFINTQLLSSPDSTD